MTWPNRSFPVHHSKNDHFTASYDPMQQVLQEFKGLEDRVYDLAIENKFLKEELTNVNNKLSQSASTIKKESEKIDGIRNGTYKEIDEIKVQLERVKRNQWQIAHDTKQNSQTLEFMDAKVNYLQGHVHHLHQCVYNPIILYQNQFVQNSNEAGHI